MKCDDIIATLMASENKNKKNDRGLSEVFTPFPAAFSLIDDIKKLHMNAYQEDGGDSFFRCINGNTLDPTCGDGQMLIAVLITRLKLANESIITPSLYSFLCRNLCGLDIKQDNIDRAKERLCEPMVGHCTKDELSAFRKMIDDNFLAGDYFVERNRINLKKFI